MLRELGRPGRWRHSGNIRLFAECDGAERARRRCAHSAALRRRWRHSRKRSASFLKMYTREQGGGDDARAWPPGRRWRHSGKRSASQDAGGAERARDAARTWPPERRWRHSRKRSAFSQDVPNRERRRCATWLPQEALAAFEETIRLFPQNAVARNARAETLRALGRPEGRGGIRGNDPPLSAGCGGAERARRQRAWSPGGGAGGIRGNDPPFPQDAVARNARGTARAWPPGGGAGGIRGNDPPLSAECSGAARGDAARARARRRWRHSRKRSGSSAGKCRERTRRLRGLGRPEALAAFGKRSGSFSGIYARGRRRRCASLARGGAGGIRGNDPALSAGMQWRGARARNAARARPRRGGVGGIRGNDPFSAEWWRSGADLPASRPLERRSSALAGGRDRRRDDWIAVRSRHGATAQDMPSRPLQIFRNTLLFFPRQRQYFSVLGHLRPRYGARRRRHVSCTHSATAAAGSRARQYTTSSKLMHGDRERRQAKGLVRRGSSFAGQRRRLASVGRTIRPCVRALLRV